MRNLILSLLRALHIIAPLPRLEDIIAERNAAARETDPNPRGWYPQAIQNKKVRRKALEYYQKTGIVPDGLVIQHIRRRLGLC